MSSMVSRGSLGFRGSLPTSLQIATNSCSTHNSWNLTQSSTAQSWCRGHTSVEEKDKFNIATCVAFKQVSYKLHLYYKCASFRGMIGGCLRPLHTYWTDKLLYRLGQNKSFLTDFKKGSFNSLQTVFFMFVTFDWVNRFWRFFFYLKDGNSTNWFRTRNPPVKMEAPSGITVKKSVWCAWSLSTAFIA